MIELRNEIMLSYLRKGLAKAYADEKPLGDGEVRGLIDEEIVDGCTYQVDYIYDTRVNKGVPYVIVYMKESTDWLDHWTHYVGKSVEL